MRVRRSSVLLAILAVSLIGSLVTGCITLKYELLKDTSLTNPPTRPIKIYIKEFPVESKASVIDPRAADAAAAQGGGQQYVTNELANKGSPLATISRPSRIEDLSGSVLRELRKEKLRVFAQFVLLEELDEDSVREIDNPFELVAGSEDADLEITGSALITSQRVRKEFSQKTQGIEVEVEVKDLSTGLVSKKALMSVGLVMTFNSRELEEAMAISVVSSLTRKLLF